MIPPDVLKLQSIAFQRVSAVCHVPATSINLSQRRKDTRSSLPGARGHCADAAFGCRDAPKDILIAALSSGAGCEAGEGKSTCLHKPEYLFGLADLERQPAHPVD